MVSQCLRVQGHLRQYCILFQIVFDTRMIYVIVFGTCMIYVIASDKRMVCNCI